MRKEKHQTKGKEPAYGYRTDNRRVNTGTQASGSEAFPPSGQHPRNVHLFQGNVKEKRKEKDSWID